MMDFAQDDFKIWVLVKQNLILAMFGKPDDSFCTHRNCCSCRSTEIAYIFNCPKTIIWMDVCCKDEEG